MAMIVAGFTGGQAEELRRAMGFKRSEKRMHDIEIKLREGMEHNGIRGQVQDSIVQAITAFALYGFPESHAASFAMIAYASAYLKCHYPAAFTAAMLNNQPMGFYHPSILIKDAQRHGLRVLPVDVTKSEWLCTVFRPLASSPPHPLAPSLRLGFRYVKGLRQQAAEAIVRARGEGPFSSVYDLALRVPELRKDEMNMLAEVGALNPLREIHRRDALWMAERAVRSVGPLLEPLETIEGASPLARMTTEERLTADFRGTGVTIGKHPMAYRRPEMQALGVTPAAHLARIPNGRLVRIAGSVIVRQRPGTAKGFVFLSMEDETGVMNAIVTPDTYNRYRLVVVGEPFLMIDGVLQNQDGVISVKAGRVAALPAGAAAESHDFH
jgi:error-prone DNA polymerase